MSTSVLSAAAGDSTCRLEGLLQEMCRLRASDLLITAGTPPQFRINGVLKPLGEVPLRPQDTEEMVGSLLDEKQMAKLFRRRNLDLSRGFEGLARFRVNVFYQRGSLAMATRLIPFRIPPFEELGLPPVIKSFASRPHGLVLITGPAGSGKSTTLASMIDYVNHRRHVHIVCIEDPIEYVHKHDKSVVDQREVLQDARSFGEALRSVFRQSPDIIMVGEMRDLESIRLALLLAETGHLILGTLHTHDTTNAVSRIASVFPTNEQQQVYAQLSMVLVGIVSQNLLVTKDNERQVLACEVMHVNSAIRNLIRERKVEQMYSVIQTGKGDGMITMNESLKNLCMQNLVHRDVALERSPEPKELQRMLDLGV